MHRSRPVDRPDCSWLKRCGGSALDLQATRCLWAGLTTKRLSAVVQLEFVHNEQPARLVRLLQPPCNLRCDHLRRPAHRQHLLVDAS